MSKTRDDEVREILEEFKQKCLMCKMEPLGNEKDFSKCKNSVLFRLNKIYAEREKKARAHQEMETVCGMKKKNRRKVDELISILSNPKYWCPSKKEQWRRIAKAIAKRQAEA